jgi:hypothetical protein
MNRDYGIGFPIGGDQIKPRSGGEQLKSLHVFGSFSILLSSNIQLNVTWRPKCIFDPKCESSISILLITPPGFIPNKKPDKNHLKILIPKIKEWINSLRNMQIQELDLKAKPSPKLQKTRIINLEDLIQ